MASRPFQLLPSLFVLLSLLQLTLAEEVNVVPLDGSSDPDSLAGPTDPTISAARFPNLSPVSFAECGFSRVTRVGVSVNKGARATLRYKIRVNAVPADELARADALFFGALPEILRPLYIKHREGYLGGLDIPFLTFMGIDLDAPNGIGIQNKNIKQSVYKKLARIVHKILKNASKEVIVARGTLKATGISCMRTTAFAFVKVAKVELRSGTKLTVLTTKDDDTLAATKHGDTLLPSSGSLRVFE